MKAKVQRRIKMLLGVGNELNGDDAVGCFIADNFIARNWLCVNTGTVPENFVGTVRKEKPSLLVIVDAAELGLKPGQFRELRKEQANSVFYSTHSLPLSEFISQVEGFVEKIILIGIQPLSTQQFSGLSSEVKQAAKKIMALLKREEWQKLQEL